MSMLTPLPLYLYDKNSMLRSASIEDLEEYKKNALKILRKNDQYATAKIVEDLFVSEISMRKIRDNLPEYIGV